MGNFDQALKIVLEFEGGYSNHPLDKGGSTMFGVTQKCYSAWRTKNKKEERDVRLITLEERDAVYLDEFWLPAKCDELGDKLAILHFDTAVNCGVGTAIKFLQESVGVKPDKLFGRVTREAVRAKPESDTLKAYLVIRKDHYNKIVLRKPSQKVFIAGWLNRLDKLNQNLA